MLKRLEIQGFKSFADKVDFHINPGVTIVVGPNGSGKSNISDSIRWVIGEQSAKSLRGSKMEDIIFSGSAKRKPVGMAEVSITFDNANGHFSIDFNEVMVTRRVFRSGESEFFINKKKCRLRDIHELFMDTGIGRETYSIIGQGKVDEILNAKPEERRVFIEEAAGIVKYRTRKLEAVRKLDDTEQNLIRINDIIAELEGQILPLKDQAEKAEQYQTYKSELTQLEIDLAVDQITKQKAKLTEAKQEQDSLNEQFKEIENEKNNSEQKLQTVRGVLEEIVQKINHQQQVIYNLTLETDGLENELKVFEERDKSFANQLERLDKERDSEILKLARLRAEHGEEEAKLNAVGLELRDLKDDLEQKEHQFLTLSTGLTEKENLIESTKDELFELLNEIAASRNHINSIENEIINARKRITQLEVSRTNLNTEKQSILDLISTSQKNLETCLKEQQNLVLATKELSQLKQDLELKTQQVGKAHEDLVREMQVKKSRLGILSDMQTEFEGYQKGVKAVLQEAKNQTNECSGVAGVIAELIKVPKEYETAIEVALGGALQNIVTETDTDAKKAINFLKLNNLGRATFLPINTIKAYPNRPDEQQILQMDGAIGRGSELVEFSAKFSGVIESLLGRVVIVENIDKAIKIARKTGYRVRLVTLDGDIINPGGSLSGGSYRKNSSNLLGRSREIEELQEYIEKKVTKLNELNNKQIEFKAKIEEYNLLLEQNRENMQELQVNKVTFEKELQRLELEIKRISSHWEVVASEIVEAEAEINSRQDDLKRLEANLEEQNTNKKYLESTLTNEQGTIKDGQLERDTRAKVITDLKVRLAGLQQEEISMKQGLQRFFAEVRSLETSVEAKAKEQEQLRLNLQNLEEQRAILKEKIIQFQLDREQAQQLMIEYQQEKQSLQNQVTQLEQEAKQESKVVNELLQKLHQVEVKMTRIEMEVENSLGRLLEEFQLTYEQALLKKQDVDSRPAVTKRISQLKLEISYLGLINMGAIEEYKRVKERYDFLMVQYEDLSKAKESLYQVIEEMNQIMVRRFEETFAIINENFAETFVALFGGGSAQLQLTNNDNLLETGIDIIAQPPSKKLQHLSLLSGGERALTAIALLFGILKYKPSPFCVLDEIEAALDEANVKRFADFVKEFSKKTQFIVVTHRKGTMEVADVLYGVTMDDGGVSKVVSMKFSDDLVAS